MEKTTYNMTKGFLLKQEELLKRIKKLKKYYNKPTIDYLISLVMLEQPVFKDIEFGELFGKTNLFFEIAKYNLCNKTIEKIENIEEIDQEKIKADFFRESLSITYHENQTGYFNVFSSNLGQKESFSNKPIKPSIIVYEMVSSVEKQIDTHEKQLESLLNVRYGSDEQFLGYNLDDEPVFMPVYGGPNSRKYFDNQYKIESLKDRIQSLKDYGTIKEKVSNLVSSSLLSDWNIKMEEEEKVNNKELILQLSWIDIYKRKNHN